MIDAIRKFMRSLGSHDHYEEMAQYYRAWMAEVDENRALREELRQTIELWNEETRALQVRNFNLENENDKLRAEVGALQLRELPIQAPFISPDVQGLDSAFLCEHANEVPVSCPCDPGCYCSTRSCKS